MCMSGVFFFCAMHIVFLLRVSERERERAPPPVFSPLSLSLVHVLHTRLVFVFSVDSCLDSVINSTTGAPCRAVENTLGAGSPVVLVRVLLVAAPVKWRCFACRSYGKVVLLFLFLLKATLATAGAPGNSPACRGGRLRHVFEQLELRKTKWLQGRPKVQ